MIQQLINKTDAFEIVRDTVAQILADESASQQALALAEIPPEDPDLWKIDVYSERANPWEKWLNSPVSSDVAPIVNVWFDADTFDQGHGGVVDGQAAVGVFNVDCYGFACSRDDGGAGHVAGDEQAAREAQRAAKLVRNILMSSEYTYLGLRGMVSRRWLRSRTSFQPAQDSRTVQKIVAVRLSYEVKYLETSPQYVGENGELVSVELKRNSDGQVLAQLDYQATS